MVALSETAKFTALSRPSRGMRGARPEVLTVIRREDIPWPSSEVMIESARIRFS